MVLNSQYYWRSVTTDVKEYSQLWKSLTDVGWNVISMNHVHEDSSFKSDSEDDGQPVQLYECWCDVVARTKTKNKPCRSVLNTLQWRYC
jgi:hypothetical protein